MARAVAPQMKDQGRGSIVNTSSIAGVMGIGSSIAYAASKGALNTMPLSLARVLAPEIRVNTVAPGFITGRWWLDKLGQENYDKMVAGVEKNTRSQLKLLDLMQLKIINILSLLRILYLI